MNHKCKLWLLTILLLLSGIQHSDADEYENAKLGFAVTLSGDWSTANADITKAITQMTSQSAIAHVKAKGGQANAETVDSAVLLMYSKLPIGTPGDNPNLILAKEKYWGDSYEKSGAGYLRLMADRVNLLHAPTTFVGDEKNVKIGGLTFYQMDAVNNKVPNAATKQRYICTFKDGYFVFFVLSFNNENDADYTKMMAVVSSFRISSREKERGAGK